MIPETSQGPAKLMTELMAREIEREKRRLGILFDAPSERVTLGAPAPGVLTFSEAYGSYKEISFVLGMRLLAACPEREGSRPVRQALTKGWHDGTASPLPTNDPAWIQVGDTLGEGRVAGITVGHSYDTAKNGQAVRSLPRRAFSDPAMAERTILSLVGPKGAWWRRGNQVLSGLPKPAPEGREELRRLRRDHGLLQDAHRATLREVLDGTGSPEKLLAYNGMVTAGLRLLETAGKAPGPADREERTLLRRRIRDLVELDRRLARPDTWSDRVGDAKALVQRELTDFRARHDAVCRRAKAGRGQEASPPAP